MNATPFQMTFWSAIHQGVEKVVVVRVMDGNWGLFKEL
jgi:hypothetical protein